MKSLKRVLPLFSYIFHPIFISIYGTLLYLLVSPNIHYIPINQIYLTLIQVSILTLLLPLSIYFLFVSLGLISSFTEASLKERRLPISLQIILLFVLIKWSVSLNSLPELYYFFLGGFFSSILVLLCVLMKFKASLHMLGITAFFSFIYALCLLYELPLINSVAFSIICVGAVASSRLYMKSHAPIELIAGILIGLIPQMCLWPFWL
jgi:hypothetical protein